jgi:hypothetical protein
MNGHDYQSYSADADELPENGIFWSEASPEPDSAPPEHDDFWSERSRSRRPSSTGPVKLLARLAGAMAVVFGVVAIIAFHSALDQRLTSDATAPTRTPTTSPPPARHHDEPARRPPEHAARHARHSQRAHHRNVAPVAVTTHTASGTGGSAPSAAGHSDPPPARKPAPRKVEVGGKVTCLSGHSVEGVWVQARVDSGYAAWQGVTIAGKAFGSTSKWWWRLPAGESYSLHVGCGGTQASWAVAADTPVVTGTSNSFECIDLPSQAGYGTCDRT